MINKLDDAFRFHATALQLREQRQAVLASNMANADTPNYKAKDIDFSQALKNALAASPAAAPVATTSIRHISTGLSNITAEGARIAYRAQATNNIDGNTVDMDVERTQFADNAVRYEAAITMINGQIKQMLTAIQG